MFLNPIGFKLLSGELTNLLYNSHWKSMVDWWNDHDSGARAWTRMIALGTTAGDSASAGQMGEYLSSVIAPGSAVSSTGNSQYFDVTSLALTAGDWDISANVAGTNNGATVTVFLGGVGTAAGNSNTGFTGGDTLVGGAVPNANYDTGASVSGIRVSISTTTTYYLKCFMTFTVATPKAYGRISARRMR